MSNATLEWLVTWIWQGSLLTVAVAGCLRWASGLNAATRFVVWWTTLLAVVILGVLTVAPRHPQLYGARGLAHDPARTTETSELVSPPPAVLPGMLGQVPAPSRTAGWALSFAWLGWGCLGLLRFIRAVWVLCRARKQVQPLSRRVERRLVMWQAVRDRGRPTRLCLSPTVPTASLLGLGPPLIALHPDFVTRTSRDDLDRVVMHEYGHSQRLDDWTGATLTVLEIAVGWHPAVWWLGRQLRLEREVASDDWVVSRTGDTHGYASCLTRIAAVGLRHGRPRLAPGVVARRGVLSTRIDRLLDSRRSTTVRPMRSVVASGLLVMLGALTILVDAPRVIAVSAVSPRTGERLPTSSLDIATLVRRPSPPVVAGLSRPPSEARLDVAAPNTSTGTGHEAAGPDLASSLARSGPQPDPTHTSTIGSNAPPAASAEDMVLLLGADLDVDMVTAPVMVTRAGQVGLHRSDALMSKAYMGPWRGVADAGRAMGQGAGRAGHATAVAFERVGTSISQAFRWRF